MWSPKAQRDGRASTGNRMVKAGRQGDVEKGKSVAEDEFQEQGIENEWWVVQGYPRRADRGTGTA